MPRPTALARAESALTAGRLREASDLLLPELDRRSAADPICALAAALIRRLDASHFDPAHDGFATALDRLLAVVETQDGQLRDLQTLLEDGL